MSMENVWFPFYVGDYLADTMHLSASEHGSYLLILFAYYKNQGPLPDDDKRLANIARVSVTDWQATRLAIASFFKIESGFWIHSRADFEIKRRKSAQVARQEAAKATNEARWKDRSPSRSPSRSPYRKTVAIPQSQSQSEEEVQKPKPSRSKPGSVEDVKLFCAKSGISENDANWFWQKCEGNGWTNGGKPIKNWQMTLTAWKTAGYLPSQKNGHHQPALIPKKGDDVQW
jgi:uncharacterized protein YdaU (DUF1376 family)